MKEKNRQKRLRLVAEAKKKPAVFTVYIILRLIVVAILVSSILRGEYENAAICLLVLFLFLLPLFFAPPFYKLDFSELPVLICAFSLGPVAGVVCEFLKVLIHLLLKGTSTAFVGDLANFLVGCSFVLPASILYQKLLSKKGAVASLALGTGVMTVFGSFFNAWFLIPRFAVMYGLPLDAIIAMGTQVNGAITDLSTLVLLAVVPFNLLKGVLVSVLTFFLYKRVERLFFRKKQPE